MPFADEMRARTFTFAADCVLFCRSLSREPDTRDLGRQLLKAGTSVAANYRAACRGRSRREFVAKLGIAVEEADETVFWLELIERVGVSRPEVVRPLRGEAGELLAILSKSLRTAKENLRTRE